MRDFKDYIAELEADNATLRSMLAGLNELRAVLEDQVDYCGEQGRNREAYYLYLLNEATSDAPDIFKAMGLPSAEFPRIGGKA